MKTKSVKRRLAAWLLLLVYVPMMVAISFHVHADEGVTTKCVQCAHHVHHGGHLDAYGDNVNDCQLCQLAELPYVTAAAVALVVAFSISRVVYTDLSQGLRVGICDVQSTRAPPFSIL